MKIAYINIYQGQVNRGVETYVSELTKRLSKKHQVEIFGGKSLPPKRWPFIWRTFIEPQAIYIGWFTLKLLPKIWKGKFDVVIPINGGWQPALLRIITWIYGGKMVISGQSGMGWDDRNNLWSFPNYFAALSSKATRWAKKVMPLVKAGYIPNGTDLTRFKPKGAKLKLKLKIKS